MAEEWLMVADFPNYEVSSQGRVRNVRTGKVLKPNYSVGGYATVSLGNSHNTRFIHRLVAGAFIGEIPHDMEIDHVDRNRANNAVANLRICSSSQNKQNRTIFNGVECEIVDEIPNEAMIIREYGNHQLENYYYHDGTFYLWNGAKYRRLTICEERNGSLFVNVRDSGGRRFAVYLAKFRRMIGED
jgi:hypothetical protein